MSEVDYQSRIPNNVDLGSDRRLQRALEGWQPDYLDWWRQMGPIGHQADDVWLRTAVSVEPGGWANFGYVRMPPIVTVEEELAFYAWDDKGLDTDTVMSLALAAWQGLEDVPQSALLGSVYGDTR